MNGAELRKAMHGGERVFGTMTSFVRNPRWAGIYSRLGFDYVIVDTEHSPTNRSEAADLAAAFAGVGICPILRVPNTHPHETLEGLDAGFHGVLVPYCEQAEEVRAVIAAARLRPLKGALHDQIRDGKATLNEQTKAYLDRRNADSVIIIGIESQAAIDNLEDILKVDGIDAIFIGPNDLSITLGVPDDYANPLYVEAHEHIIATANKYGLPAGGHMFRQDLVEFWMQKGSRFILYNSDAAALSEGYRGALNSFRGEHVKEMAQTL
ncbi:MAG TPA: aldolase/citrate lyase family protein [Thermomicrobiales bacterium]|jgi:4-hydroxy-2-oxoheptanedioate aldolase